MSIYAIARKFRTAVPLPRRMPLCCRHRSQSFFNDVHASTRTKGGHCRRSTSRTCFISSRCNLDVPFIPVKDAILPSPTDSGLSWRTVPSSGQLADARILLQPPIDRSPVHLRSSCVAGASESLTSATWNARFPLRSSLLAATQWKIKREARNFNNFAEKWIEYGEACVIKFAARDFV